MTKTLVSLRTILCSCCNIVDLDGAEDNRSGETARPSYLVVGNMPRWRLVLETRSR